MTRLFLAPTLALLATGLLFSSCMSEQLTVERKKMTFAASIEDSKTQIVDRTKLHWNQGDCISVCEQIAAEGQKGSTFVALQSGATSTFKGSAPELSNYYALYPASAVRNWKPDGSAAVYTKLPADQKAIPGNVDPDALIMCAKATAAKRSFNFKVAVALVKFTIGKDSPEIVSISLNAPNQYIAGTSSLNTSYSNPALAGTGNKTSTVNLAREDHGVLEPGDYYLAIIPRTYTNLEFRFTNKFGEVASKTLSSVSFAAGTAYSAGEIPQIFERDNVETYQYSEKVPRSELYTVSAGNTDQLVYPTDEAHICTFGAKRSIEVSVTAKGVTPSSVQIRPLAKNITPTISGNTVKFRLAPYDRVSVEINGDISHPLLVFVNPVEEDKPSPQDTKVKYLSAGYYNASSSGVNLTNSGKKTLYLEGGAVLKGNVAAKEDSDIEIKGFGIIDARSTTACGINISGTKNIFVGGIILVNAANSSTVFKECSNVRCDNYKVVATASPIHSGGAENDAFDFFGTHDVNVSRCFGYCHDDVYIIASKSLRRGFDGPTYGYLFTDCIGWNVKAGNTFEIGYATANDVSDVTFRDCYSIHSNNNHTQTSSYTKGAIAIHSCSYGTVRDITYENIYIEDPQCYTTVLEIKKSPFDDLPDYEGGYIRNVKFKNIHITKDGPDHSVFTGYDAVHNIDGVNFDNYCIDGKPATDLQSAGVVSSTYAYNITFGTQAKKVETYTYSPKLSSSDRYAVTVEGEKQFIYPTKTLETYDEQLHVCAFGCNSEVTVKVNLKSGSCSGVTVRPVSKDFGKSYSAGTLTLRMKPGDRAIVEFDNDNKHPLMLFANAFEKRPASATYYYKAGGIYSSTGKITLKDGESVYVEGGAVLNADIRCTDADNISICGPGIIDGSEISAYVVHLNKWANLNIESVCVIGRDSPPFWLASGNNLTMKNAKSIALFSRKNSSGNENDALDLVSVSHARVSQGFSYSHDDCCIIKSGCTTGGVLYEGPSIDIVVDDHISAYRDTGHGCGIGYSCFDEIKDITFRNIYVPYEYPVTRSNSRKGQLAVHNTGDATVSNVTFENIYLEQASKGQAIYVSVFQYPGHDYGETGYVPGHINGVTFRNIHVDGPPEFGNYILGYNSNHKVQGVKFDGLYYGNKKIMNRTDARITDGDMGGYNRIRFNYAEEPTFL